MAAGSSSHHLLIILILALLIRAITALPAAADKNGKKPVTPRRRYLPRFGRALELASIPQPLTIRRCDCDETDSCMEEAYKEVTQCKAACQNELIYFGPDTEEYLSCFEDNMMEANVIGECLEENSPDYCSINGTMHQLELELLRSVDSSFINGTDSAENNSTSSSSASTTNATEPFASTTTSSFTNGTESNSTSSSSSASTTTNTTEQPIENADKVFSLIKKANLISLYFVKFETCVVNCLKNHVNTCLQQASCWIKIPRFTSMEDVLFVCSKFESLAQYQSQNACQCLASKHKIRKLIPVCPFLGLTF